MIQLMKQIWFVHLGYEPPLPLKVEILPNHRARVIGGKSGSHLTGHNENYRDKITEVIRLGYIPSEIAKDLGFVSPDWTPPDESQLDSEIQKEAYLKRI